MLFPIIAVASAIAVWYSGFRADFSGAEKKLNDAKERHESNIARLQFVSGCVSREMEMLGKAELAVAKDFMRFSDTFEAIKNRPVYSEKKTSEKIPEFDFEDIKTVSVNTNAFLRKVVGSNVGAILMCVATGGIGSLVIGIAFASAGAKAKKQAEEAFDEMLKSEGAINNSIVYMNQIQSTASKLRRAIKKVHKIYDKYVAQLERLVNKNSEWDTYEDGERLLVENTILIVTVLHKMINAPLLRVTSTDEKGEPTDTILDSKNVKQTIDSSISTLSKSGIV